MARKRTHKADGLYYVTPRMLEKKMRACEGARRVIYNIGEIKTSPECNYMASKEDMNKPIPVTLNLLDRVSRVTSPTNWAVATLNRAKVSFESDLAYPSYEGNWDSRKDRAAEARGLRYLMDRLYYRARRDGLVTA